MNLKPPVLDPRSSLFLDVDGTLLEFTATPSQTTADRQIGALLDALAQRLAGALALVSGREIRTMDALFAPLRLPCAGLHGAERRDARGVLHGSDTLDAGLDAVRGELGVLALHYPGTIIEDKGRSIGVHYRLAPQFADQVRAAALQLAAAHASGYDIQEGAMLVEIKPRGITKGTAVEAFLREAPFTGRPPVFVGDDLTDLHGFEAVERAGGYSVGVGPRVTGTYHLEGVVAVRRWLSARTEHG